jgi:putative membrane protein
MLDARKFLSDEAQGRVAYAITEAERHTGAEILVAVATESGRYDRAESICGLFCALIALGALHVGVQVTAEPGSWGQVTADIAWQSLAVVLGFVAGSVLASYVHPVRRLFVSRKEMNEEASRGANLVFMANDLHSTTHRAGILIYLSLFERRVIVLPDAALLGVVGMDLAEEVCATVREHLRAGRREEALVSAVKIIGERLAEKFPEQRDNADNEIPNHLILIHPRP